MAKPTAKWEHPSVIKLLKTVGETDAIRAIRRMARDLVSKAYDKGWAGPPFNPFELADLLNIEVLPNDSIRDASIKPLANNRFLIEYNPNQRPSRINFTIAHEIGHFLFPDCASSVKSRTAHPSTQSWEIEFLCNVAASEILLPYNFFAQDANEVPLEIDSLLSLSEKYAASLEAIFLRFTEVVEKPCAIIIASFEVPGYKKLVVDYFRASRLFQPKLARRSVVPRSSKAYECVNSGWTSKAVEKWRSLGGAEHVVHSIGLPPLRKQKNQRVGIFVAPRNGSGVWEPGITYLHGNATEPMGSGVKVIAQVVNTRAGLGFGFGRAMSSKWPASKKALKSWKEDSKDFQLSRSRATKLAEDVYVFQMLAQKGLKPSRGHIPLRYEALRKCLSDLRLFSKELKASVHMPRIGAGQARGDWKIIEGMIHEELANQDIEVFVYDLPGTKRGRKQEVNLNLFGFIHGNRRGT